MDEKDIRKKINKIYHIAVHRDSQGGMFVGLYTFNTAPSGQKRIEPVITYDKPIRSKAAVDLIIQAFLKIELTDFWAEMYELPKDALKYLDVPRLVPEAAVRAAENVRE